VSQVTYLNSKRLITSLALPGTVEKEGTSIDPTIQSYRYVHVTGHLAD